MAINNKVRSIAGRNDDNPVDLYMNIMIKTKGGNAGKAGYVPLRRNESKLQANIIDAWEADPDGLVLRMPELIVVQFNPGVKDDAEYELAL